MSEHEGCTGWSDFTVIIPTLNEAGTIGQLLAALLNRYPDVRLLVVDDVSTDGTQELVRQAGREAQEGQVRLLERHDAVERGITAAVLDGLEQVQTRFFLVMDGDLQHPPEVAGELMQKLKDGAGIAAGARLPYRENQGIHRIIMTRFATRLAQRYLRRRGFDAADPMSGFFGGDTEKLRSAARQNRERFEGRGYKVFFDLLKCLDPSIRFEQVFYQFGLRERGRSKLRPAHALYFLRSLLR